MIAVGLAAAAHQSDAVSGILLILAFVLVAAMLGGDMAERLRQPGVLGELTVGIVLDNLTLVGGPSLTDVAQGETFTVLAELGAVLLLFQAGLESTPREMLAVGGRAALVAVTGVVAPMVLGFGVGEVFRSRESWMLHAFLGAMLAATSVGITARVLKDKGLLKAPFARIVLGAAVIDDVLGLLVLAVVSGIITAAATGGRLSLAAVAIIALKAFAFLFGALPAGMLSCHAHRGLRQFPMSRPDEAMTNLI